MRITSENNERAATKRINENSERKPKNKGK